MHAHRYDWTLLIPCFVAGLLGGAVYVAGFSLISRNTREEYRELALVSSSIADTIGIMLSDVCGLVLQVSTNEVCCVSRAAAIHFCLRLFLTLETLDPVLTSTHTHTHIPSGEPHRAASTAQMASLARPSPVVREMV